MDKKKKWIIGLIIISSIIIGTGLIVGLRLDFGVANVTELGCLANLDPDNHQSLETKAILDIDKAHDAEHTTYRVSIYNFDVDLENPNDGAWVYFDINEEKTPNTLKYWRFGEYTWTGEDIALYVTDGHFVFEGIFDITDASIGTTYILQLTFEDNEGDRFTIYKYFAFEDIPEPPPPYETPAIRPGTEDVIETDSSIGLLLEVSFEVENYEHVTSIVGFFTLDGNIVEDGNGDAFQFTFATQGDGFYEGEFNLQTLPKNDMFLEIKVFYTAEDDTPTSFILEEFHELLLGIDYLAPEVLVDTRVIGFSDPHLDISFEVKNFEHVTSIAGFFTIDGERIVDEDDNVIAFAFVSDADGCYEGEYSMDSLPDDVDISVCLQVTFFDENGEEDSFIMSNFAIITSEGEIVTPTPTITPIVGINYLFAIITTVVAFASFTIIKKKKKK